MNNHHEKKKCDSSVVTLQNIHYFQDTKHTLEISTHYMNSRLSQISFIFPK
jgi:hypothetical protein